MRSAHRMPPTNPILLLGFIVGCSAHHVAEPRVLSPLQPTPPVAADSMQRVAYQEAADEKEKPKQKITLPQAIQMCIANNFRIRIGAEVVRQAEADFTTASLIPNPSLLADYQLIPLQHADIHNQLGPPEADALLTVPIDWLLFGKRVAAMEAARLGIEVSNADYADVHRVQVGRTVDAFYEILETKAYFNLSEENYHELQQMEKLTEEMAKANKVGKLDLDRIKLAVHESLLERHDRELAYDLARAKLRPFLGRTAADPDFEVDGTLAVTAIVPPPKLPEALALAEVHRPDLISDRHDVDRARAVTEREERQAKPQISVIPGMSYYNQRHITGFRDGPMFDFGVSTSLPLTDRNQGNIRKARAREQEMQQTYFADRADAFAEVEAAVDNYDDAVEHLTQFNTADTMKAAYDIKKEMEAAYKAGDRKLVEFLDAQKAYRDRLAHVVEFESTYWRMLNRLNMAVGLQAYEAK